MDVHILIRNLTGKEFATVDFRDKIYKALYNDIFPNNEERILQLFQNEDQTNQGMLKGDSLMRVLG